MSTEVEARRAAKEFSPSSGQKSNAQKLAEKKGKTGKGSIIVKPQLCGKYCGTCPHGPYAWHVYKGEWTYLGSVGASLGKKSSEKQTEAKASSSGSSRSMSYGEMVEYEKEFVREAAHENAEDDYRGTPEDLRVEQIQGIGPKRAEVLQEQGIETRADIAEMDRDDLMDLYLALPRDSFRSIKQVYDQYHGDE